MLRTWILELDWRSEAQLSKKLSDLFKAFTLLMSAFSPNNTGLEEVICMGA